MSKMEKAVQDLAIALEDLSVRVEKSVLGSADSAESLGNARNQAQAAQKHAGKAALELATVIDGLKTMIAKSEGDQSADTPKTQTGN